MRITATGTHRFHPTGEIDNNCTCYAMSMNAIRIAHIPQQLFKLYINYETKSALWPWAVIDILTFAALVNTLAATSWLPISDEELGFSNHQ